MRTSGQLYLRKRNSHTLRARWHKRFFFVDQEKGQVKYFKNDQALEAKGSIPLQGTNVRSHEKGSKKFYIVITVGGNEFDLKSKRREDRDEWLATIMAAQRVCAESDERRRYQVEIDRLCSTTWAESIQRSGYSGVQVCVDWASLDGIAEHAQQMRCAALLQSGGAIAFLSGALSRLCMAEKGPVPVLREPLERIVLRCVSGTAQPRWLADSFYDKSTRTMHCLLSFTGERLDLCSEARLQRVLTTSVWKKEAEQAVEAALRPSVDTAGRLLGVPHLPIAVEWGEDEPDPSCVAAYVGAHVTPTLGRQIVDAVAAACEAHRAIHSQLATVLKTAGGHSSRLALPPRLRNLDETSGSGSSSEEGPSGSPPAAPANWAQIASPLPVLPLRLDPNTPELGRCLSSITLLIDNGLVCNNSPPLVLPRRDQEILVRTVSRARSECGALKKRRMLSARFSGISSHEQSQQSHADRGFAVCQSSPARLSEELTLAFCFVNLIDIVEAIEVSCRQWTSGPGFIVLGGVQVGWEQLHEITGRLGLNVRAACHLALSLLIEYKSRLEALAIALRSSGRQAEFPRCVGKIQVEFTAEPDRALPRLVPGGVLVDCCLIGRQGTTPAVSFPGDLASWCLTQFESRALVPVDGPLVDEEDSSGSSCDETDGASTVLSSSLSLSSTFGAVSSRSMTVSSPSAVPRTPQKEENAVACIVRRLDQLANTDYEVAALAERYPFDESALSAVIAAITKEFAPAKVSDRDIVCIVCEALIKLRRLCQRWDPERTALFNAAAVTEIATEFAEHEGNGAAGSPPAISHMAERIASLSRCTPSAVPFAALGRTLLTELLPKEVKHCVRCRRNLVLLGLDNTGKTLLVNALRNRRTQTYPTLGAQVSSVVYRNLNFSVTELGGSSEQRAGWLLHTKHARDIHGIIFVVDAADRVRLPEAKKAFKKLLLAKHLRRVPVLLLVNNSNAPGCVPPTEVFNSLRCEKYCAESKREIAMKAIHMTTPTDQPQDQITQGLDWLYQKLEKG